MTDPSVAVGVFTDKVAGPLFSVGLVVLAGDNEEGKQNYYLHSTSVKTYLRVVLW